MLPDGESQRSIRVKQGIQHWLELSQSLGHYVVQTVQSERSWLS